MSIILDSIDRFNKEEYDFICFQDVQDFKHKNKLIEEFGRVRDKSIKYNVVYDNVSQVIFYNKTKFRLIKTYELKKTDFYYSIGCLFKEQKTGCYLFIMNIYIVKNNFDIQNNNTQK